MANEANKPVRLGGMQAHTRVNFNKAILNEGTCATQADTAAKEVTLGTTFELVQGATVIVTFTNGISVDNATLAVTHTDLEDTTTTETAKAIYYRGAALGANYVKSNQKVILRYDGTRFNIIGNLDEPQTFLDVEDLTADMTFKKNTYITINGVVYRSTADTNYLPFTPVIYNDNGTVKLVYSLVNGHKVYVFDSFTLNPGWEVLMTLSEDFYTKNEIDALRAPVYDPTTKGITFPSTATFQYNSANKEIIISH